MREELARQLWFWYSRDAGGEEHVKTFAGSTYTEQDWNELLIPEQRDRWLDRADRVIMTVYAKEEQPMTVYFGYAVIEHYPDGAPEPFGIYAHPTELGPPQVGAVILLRWSDGRPAYHVEITKVRDLTLHVTKSPAAAGVAAAIDDFKAKAARAIDQALSAPDPDVEAASATTWDARMEPPGCVDHYHCRSIAPVARAGTCARHRMACVAPNVVTSVDPCSSCGDRWLMTSPSAAQVINEAIDIDEVRLPGQTEA